VEISNFTLESFKSYLITQASPFLIYIYLLTLQDFHNAYPSSVNLTTLMNVIDKLSLTFGELRNYDIEHFFMNNPIWQRPIIKDDETYYCFVPGLLVSFCVEQMEFLIKDYEVIWGKYVERRGDYLEKKTEELFRTAFPEAKIFSGSKWNDPDDHKEYENDLLVLTDTTAFVIEAKSGKMRPKAKRGDRGSLEGDIDKLFCRLCSSSQSFYLFSQTASKIFL
jgi:hypothetical protein